MNSKKENLLLELKEAFSRFSEVMKKEKDEFMRDSAIQRFEFTFELLWKTLKAYLEDKGVHEYAPRDVIKSAFQSRIIDEDEIWLEMLKTRNLTSHIYNKAMADGVYNELPKYVDHIRKLIEDIE